MKNIFIKIFAVLIVFFASFVFINAQTNDSAKSNQSNVQNIKPLKILKKPRASMLGNCSQKTGEVILEVTFDKLAKVTESRITSSSGCNFFDNSALTVSRKIKFEPQTENGEAVTIKRFVSYAFSYY